MAIRIGKWDCEQCGHKGNLGPTTKCEKCGASRPENVKFYLADDAEIVIDENKIKEAYSGADWICSFCKTQNKAVDKICISCGNDREISDGDKSLNEKEYRFDEKIKDLDEQTPINKSKNKKKAKGCLIAIAVFFAIFIFSIFSTFITKDINVTVKDFKWESQLNLLEY
ncbi:MAG: hypothetical protein JXR51_11605 [Bacteroidales bacterium]|nr:hypothetical protein [Bacteroidales bacterium]MBN2757816.1 hypothetical protein [Bacteroidales bacterium]